METSKQFIAFSSFLLGMIAAGLFFMSGIGISGMLISEPTKSLQAIPPIPDTLNDSSLSVYNGRVVIDIANASMVSYEDTGSMLPFLTNYSHGIRVRPESQFDIQVGDIVSFGIANITIVHRVVEVGSDTTGIYYITQGDNNLERDTRRLRFGDIQWKLVGIIY